MHAVRRVLPVMAVLLFMGSASAAGAQEADVFVFASQSTTVFAHGDGTFDVDVLAGLSADQPYLDQFVGEALDADALAQTAEEALEATGLDIDHTVGALANDGEFASRPVSFSGITGPADLESLLTEVMDEVASDAEVAELTGAPGQFSIQVTLAPLEDARDSFGEVPGFVFEPYVEFSLVVEGEISDHSGEDDGAGGAYWVAVDGQEVVADATYQLDGVPAPPTEAQQPVATEPVVVEPSTAPAPAAQAPAPTPVAAETSSGGVPIWLIAVIGAALLIVIVVLVVVLVRRGGGGGGGQLPPGAGGGPPHGAYVHAGAPQGAYPPGYAPQPVPGGPVQGPAGHGGPPPGYGGPYHAPPPGVPQR